MKNKIKALLIFFLVAVLVFGMFVYRTLNLGISSCNSDKIFFTASPIAVSSIYGIVPLGNLGPPSHTFPTNHLYFYTQRLKPGDFNSGPVEVPVVSPGDMWITSIASSEHLSGEKFTDYSLTFSPCKDFEAYFHHVSSLSPKLSEAFGSGGDCDEYSTGGKSYRRCEKSMNIKVSAGEIIGTAGKFKSQHALDFGASDFRTPPLNYANPSRWYKRQKHLVCSIDYFSPEVRSLLQSKLGSHDGSVRRTVQPFCGEVEQDVSGTAQGVWFVEGAEETYPEDPHLSLVYDNIDPARGVFSVGTSVKGLRSSTYYFIPSKNGFVNRDFKDVKADGNIYCYETVDSFSNFPKNFIILLQLADEKTLRLEKKDFVKCVEPLGFSDYTAFER
ncbi:MAG TPA: hypothetical protein VJG30_01275 [Candidatus Nanoarchaeia archaeon]|nr:hypothetical protein [Candidatus Nanoarchaeia archaeon]